MVREFAAVIGGGARSFALTGACQRLSLPASAAAATRWHLRRVHRGHVGRTGGRRSRGERIATGRHAARLRVEARILQGTRTAVLQDDDGISVHALDFGRPHHAAIGPEHAWLRELDARNTRGCRTTAPWPPFSRWRSWKASSGARVVPCHCLRWDAGPEARTRGADSGWNLSGRRARTSKRSRAPSRPARPSARLDR